MCADVRRGLSLLGSPGRYLRRVVPWGVLSRVLRIGALVCLLAAFGLPATLTAVLVVMVAHASGRLVPFGPAGTGASLGLLVAAFPAVTHTDVTAGEITAFYLGATGVLTVVGIVLSTLVLIRELGLSGARGVAGQVLERLRAPRKAPVRVPAA